MCRTYQQNKKIARLPSLKCALVVHAATEVRIFDMHGTVQAQIQKPKFLSVPRSWVLRRLIHVSVTQNTSWKNTMDPIQL